MVSSHTGSSPTFSEKTSQKYWRVLAATFVGREFSTNAWRTPGARYRFRKTISSRVILHILLTGSGPLGHTTTLRLFFLSFLAVSAFGVSVRVFSSAQARACGVCSRPAVCNVAVEEPTLAAEVPFASRCLCHRRGQGWKGIIRLISLVST